MKASILIPCFNARRWVGAAVASALAQTEKDREVVVVDDGSTDGSAEVLKGFGDAIRWESTPNRGGGAARNRLLELARGAWLQYLDADDCLLPGHLASQLAAAAANPGADVICSPGIMEHWPGDGAGGDPPADARDPGPALRRVHPIPEPRDPWVLLARWHLPQTGAVLLRKEAVAAAGGWKVGQPCCQEHELYGRLLAAGRTFACAETPGAVYRQWSTGTVCRRDPALTNRTRLEVVARLADHLEARGMWTPERRRAVALARLECARSLYRPDREGALAAAALAREGLRGEELPDEPAFPASYRAAFRLLGFRGAEILAAAVRPLRAGGRREGGPAKVVPAPAAGSASA